MSVLCAALCWNWRRTESSHVPAVVLFFTVASVRGKTQVGRCGQVFCAAVNLRWRKREKTILLLLLLLMDSVQYLKKGHIQYQTKFVFCSLLQSLPCWSDVTRKKTVWFPRKTLRRLFLHPHQTPSGGSVLIELKTKQKNLCCCSHCLFFYQFITESTFSSLTHCQSSWCHLLNPTEGWIQLSVSGVRSNPNQGRKDAAWLLRLHLESEFPQKKIRGMFSNCLRHQISKFQNPVGKILSNTSS